LLWEAMSGRSREVAVRAGRRAAGRALTAPIPDQAIAAGIHAAQAHLGPGQGLDSEQLQAVDEL
jgi:hypothetical protein